MTELANGIGQNSGIGLAENVNSNPNIVHEAPQSAPEERSFRQSEVNEIVKRAKNDAVETYKRLHVEQPSYAQQKYGDSLHQPQSSSSHSEENYRKIASEEAKRFIEEARQEALRQSQTEQAHRTVQNFYAKTGKGREKYQDFDQVTGDVDLGRFPNVVQLLGEFIENSDEVFYELGKDRIKMAQLEALAERSPNDAVRAARSLAQSIKDNQEASRTKFAKEPLSQMRPSNYGTDSGALSVSDYRKKYKV